MGELKKHQPPMTIDEQVENLKRIGLVRWGSRRIGRNCSKTPKVPIILNFKFLVYWQSYKLEIVRCCQRPYLTRQRVMSMKQSDSSVN